MATATITLQYPSAHVGGGAQKMKAWPVGSISSPLKKLQDGHLRSFYKSSSPSDALFHSVRQSCVFGVASYHGGGAMGVQMNTFVRVRRIFQALVEGIVSVNEDPEKILEQAAEEMSNDLAKLRQTAAQVVASKRMLEAKYQNSKNTSGEWYRRARLALEKGDEMLAKEALKRKKECDETASALKAQLEQQTAISERILSSSRALEIKIIEAKSKKENLKARAQAAKTSVQIQEMLGSIDTTSALAAYEKMEEKVIRLEAEADALSEISADQLTTKFAVLEAEDVGDDFEKLKKEIEERSAKPQLPLFTEKIYEKEPVKTTIHHYY